MAVTAASLLNEAEADGMIVMLLPGSRIAVWGDERHIVMADLLVGRSDEVVTEIHRRDGDEPWRAILEEVFR